MSSSDHEERLRQLELALNTLQRNAENHEASAQARVNKMDQVDRMLQELRMEIHGAKAGGRVLIGVWMVLGPVLGMLGVWLKDHLAKMLLIGSLVCFASCAQLTPEQQAELATMRQQVLAAETGIRAHAQDLEQARKDFASGKLTQEQLNGLVIRSQEQVAALIATAQAASAKVADLQRQGVPPWQTIWEGGIGQIAISLAGAWLLAKQGDKGAVEKAVARVTEIRGPIEARKGSAPKAG